MSDQRIETLKKELEEATHPVLKRYLQLAVDADNEHLRNHYLHEVRRIRHYLKLKASGAWRRQQDDARARREKFESCSDPVATLEVVPEGVKLRWEKPADWDPDSWMIVCRDPGGEWASITPRALEDDDREEVVSLEVMLKGGRELPVELGVAAIKDDCGMKVSNAMPYPPVDEKDPEGGYTVPADLIATVRGYYNMNRHRPSGGVNWFRVLIAFGAETHATLQPFTAAEAEAEAAKWSGWRPIADALRKLEAAK